MHTESTITAAQAYITRHRMALSVALGTLLTVVLVSTWYLIVAPLLHIGSVNMGLAVSAFSALCGAVAALATYWGTE